MSVKRNPNLGPSQMRAKKRRLFLIRLTIVSFFVLLILFGLAIFSGHQKVKIQNISLSGNAAVSDEEILSIVRRDLVGRYGYLFSKSNSLIFPRFRIKRDLLAEIKTIKDLEISWEGWQKISINISERKPHAVWCGDTMPDFEIDKGLNIKETECFFLDNSGYIFSRAPVFSGGMFVKDYGLLSSLETDPIGSYFLTKETYEKIFSLLEILEQNRLSVVSLFFDGYDYRFKLSCGPTIIFNDKSDFISSFENLFSAIETKNLDLENESELINYIDLRFDNKVVVGKKEL
jgi:hypothetical protein